MYGFRPIEFDKYISPDGRTYNFETGVTKFLISGITGQGMPGIDYRVQRGPFQDGVTPLGFTLGERTIIFTHRRNAGCREAYWEIRSDLLNFIRPNRQELNTFTPGVLRKILPNGDKRDLNVFIQEGPEFAGAQSGRWDEFSFQEVLTFVAHDPIFFDPTQNLLQLTLPTGSDQLTFPITFPISFSSPGGIVTDSVTYAGTYKSFPVFTLTGPLQEPIIDNITTGERIKLETTIVAGQTVTIDLQFGNKSVVDDLGNNLIGELSTDSDLAEWHLAPDPEAAGGVNGIGFTAQGITANSVATMKYFTRYIGI